jgi:hypothetical protein
MTFEENPLCSALEIVILTVLERPHEGRESRQSEADRDGHQEKEIDHWRDPRVRGTDGPCRPAKSVVAPLVRAG